MDYSSHNLLNTRQTILQQKPRWNEDTKKRARWFYAVLENFAREEPIAILVPLANLEDNFNNCGVCEGDAIRILACFLSHGSKESYKSTC